jgi:ribosomal-protein-alanine N-acetyltransferase
MEFETLATERLLLRKLTPEGIRYIFANYPEEEIKRQLGLLTDEDFIRDKKKNEGGYTTYDRTIVHFKLILKDTNEVIGGGGFHNWYAVHNRAELGYVLNKDEHKRKGYMSEAVSTMLEYGFKEMNLNRVEACIGPENEASLAVVKKFGFTQEGYLRKHYVVGGETHDSLIFSLLKEEYEGMNSNH